MTCIHTYFGQATIARNKDFLVSLGIDKPLIDKKVTVKTAPAARKRKTLDDPAYSPPERRSTRAIANVREAPKVESDDDDDEYVEETKRAPKKPRVSNPAGGAAAQENPASDACIQVEAAKTGIYTH